MRHLLPLPCVFLQSELSLQEGSAIGFVLFLKFRSGELELYFLACYFYFLFWWHCWFFPPCLHLFNLADALVQVAEVTPRVDLVPRVYAVLLLTVMPRQSLLLGTHMVAAVTQVTGLAVRRGVSWNHSPGASCSSSCALDVWYACRACSG